GRNIPNVVELAKKVDYVVCSREFAESYTGINIDFSDVESIKNIYSKMSSDFKNVVITLEEKGSLYKNGNNIIVMPSIKVSVKDSTGAGDYFHGAFVYCLINGFDMDKTIKISNVTGALSTTKVGARNSVPSLEEVMKYV
ncbi:MAG: PfkB family carbohydrate kinase, partial [Bacilli bacterium]|nr:PfkB family carbohydrate kinase [Bacilli bacterium]